MSFRVGAPMIWERNCPWQAFRGSSTPCLLNLPRAPLLSVASPPQLALFDWRTSSAPNLDIDERQMQAAYRGSGGYSILRQQVLANSHLVTNPRSHLLLIQWPIGWATSSLRMPVRTGTPRTLSEPQQIALRRASKLPLEYAFQRRARTGSNYWLSRNRYRHDIVRTVTAEAANALDGRKLADYAAASIPLHLSDGWCLLARAAGAVTNGDWPNAIHLGYYAELRAAMALLATQGSHRPRQASRHY